MAFCRVGTNTNPPLARNVVIVHTVHHVAIAQQRGLERRLLVGPEADAEVAAGLVRGVELPQAPGARERQRVVPKF